MSRVEYLRFDNMALTDSTHETSSRLVKLLVEVRGNSEEVISVETFLTLFEKYFWKMGEGVLKLKLHGKQDGDS